MAQFLRFELLTNNAATGQPDGLFVGAYGIVGAGPSTHSAYYVKSIRRLLDWFRDNLKRPSRFNASKSKGWRSREHTAGIAWFKPDAMEHIAKMREMALAMRECGVEFRERTTDRPGKIVYEDEIQIIAEPYHRET